jgi:hypothetical protein
MQDLEFLERLESADFEASAIEGGQTNLVIKSGGTTILDLQLTNSPFGGFFAGLLKGIFGEMVSVTPAKCPIQVGFKFVV